MRDILTGTPKRITESTLIYTGAGVILSLLIGADGINDPVIAVYDDIDADTAANRIIPSQAFDASALGLNGVIFPYPKKFSTGLYIAVSNLGSGEIIVDYRTLAGLKLYTVQ